MNRPGKLENNKPQRSRGTAVLTALKKGLRADLVDSVNCNAAGCSFWRRLRRRLCWRNSRIRLHDTWYCAPQCFELALLQHLRREVLPSRERFVQSPEKGERSQKSLEKARASTITSPPHRIPLGLLLLSRGQLNNAQLRAALALQQAEGGHIGECLETLGFVNESQVTAALAAQWSCPVWPATSAPLSECAYLLPITLLRAFQIYPLRFVVPTRTFYLAFSERLDHSILYAIAQMLQCRTEPCVMRSSILRSLLAGIEHIPRCADVLFESPEDHAEIARITCAYVLKLGAQQVRLATCRNYVWARLSSGNDTANLVFHLPADALRGAKTASWMPGALRDAG